MRGFDSLLSRRSLHYKSTSKIVGRVTGPAVELALHSGMRLGEQFNLRWQDVDFERRMVTLQTTRNGRPRYIPLNDLAVSALRDAERQSAGQPLVFLNR
jgi:integrase